MKHNMSQKVKLTTIRDNDTGLTMNSFEWLEDGQVKVMMELANRPAQYRGINRYGSPSFSVLAHDEKVDGEIAEQRRWAIEQALIERTNGKSGCLTTR